MDPVRGLAFDRENRLYVAARSGVKAFSIQGDPSLEIRPTSSPCGIAVDQDGFIYIAGRTRISKFGPSGEPAASWGREVSRKGKFRYITALSVHDGFLSVADAGRRSIHRVAVDGDYVDELPGFSVPSAYFDCKSDAEGLLHVGHTARHQVETYDRNGKLVTAWGKHGSAVEDFCGCCNPTNLAVFPDGRIATAEKGIPRIKLYDPAGNLLAHEPPADVGAPENADYLRRLPAGEGGLPSCHDGWPGMPMAADSEGRLAVAVPGTGEIRIFSLLPA